MFIIPIGRKPDWRRPPVVTLLLILINCLIYLGPQRADERATEQAVAYYGESALPAIEFPRYLKFLEDAGREEDAEAFTAMERARALYPAVMTLQYDRPFRRELAARRIALPDDPDHARWREQRDEFERRWGHPTTERYAFDTADPRPRQFIGHMFLHGSLGHLLGNMLFLLLVGYIVEELLGKLRYLAFYLVGGLGAVSLFWLADRSADAMLVGASGAIAAVMGMYTVIFGLKRIEFFYSLFFYFDIAKAPAIVLLPFWLANELYQLWTLPYSNVAYVAHIGGLVTGAALVYLLGGAARKTAAAAPTARSDRADLRAGEFARAEALLKKLQFERALPAWAALAAKYPEDRRAVAQFYALAKPRPESEDYHRAAGLVFRLHDTDAAALALQAETYAEYIRIARPIRLLDRHLVRLAERFALHGRPRDAEQILRVLLRRPGSEHLPELLFKLAKGFRGTGDLARAQDWTNELLERFPQSEEARLMRQAG